MAPRLGDDFLIHSLKKGLPMNDTLEHYKIQSHPSYSVEVVNYKEMKLSIIRRCRTGGGTKVFAPGTVEEGGAFRVG